MNQNPIIIAGPCSAESEEQVLKAACELSSLGITHFRAGLWKPRTRPGGFEGVGAKGLAWLEKAHQLTGMEVMTEVACRAHLEYVAASGLRTVWIGARTATNPFAVQEIVDSITALGLTKMRVWIKNPVNPDIELWVGAIERFLSAGITEVGAIHRGFSSYSPGLYRNPPHWAIPIELKRRMPDITLLHDPSHTSGAADMIERLTIEAMALCFDGLMIETHPNPEKALSDARQQITPHKLGEILTKLHNNTVATDENELHQLRCRIDTLDRELVDILARRLDVCREIGMVKATRGLPVMSRERYSKLLSEIVEIGKTLNLDAGFLHRLFAIIHEESVRTQLNLKNNLEQ